MSLKLIYITNRIDIAQIAESAGVDRILVDLEYIGKEARQGGMNTVQSHHVLEDIRKLAESIDKAELLVRVNPIHNETDDYISSKEEIDKAIEYGANIVMLPYFKTVEEIDKILKIPGLDEVLIGLNDLSLGYGKKFMFELLSDGTVEDLCYKFRKAGIPYGFGGIAALGKGDLPAERIIMEHYRLGSTRAILSRSFCNTDTIKHMGIISETFVNGVREIRSFEKKVAVHSDFFIDNMKEIHEITGLMGKNNC
jgi:hypothetical protein